MDRLIANRTNRTVWKSRIGGFLAVLFFMLMLPMAVSILLIPSKKQEEEGAQGLWLEDGEYGRYEAICRRAAGDIRIPLESCLVSLLAGMMETDAPREALRAAAILLRTQAVYETEKHGSYIAEGYRTPEELRRQWGEQYEEYSAIYARAVSDTKGMIMTHEGVAIDTAYHQISAGTTRETSVLAADHDLLWKSVRCEQDMLEQDYRTIVECDSEKLAARIASLAGTDTVAGVRIIIEERDAAGYVLSVSITGEGFRGMMVGGERFRSLFGLPSSDFLLEQTEKGVRFTCFGRGHGYGMSLCYAKTLAARGSDCMDILRYFFKEIEFMRIA